MKKIKKNTEKRLKLADRRARQIAHKIDATEAMKPAAPTRMRRFLSAIGFRYGSGPDMEDLENAPGFCEGYSGAEITAVFDIQDRIRILFGGIVILHLRMKTDKPIDKLLVRSAIGVPWMKIKKIIQRGTR